MPSTRRPTVRSVAMPAEHGGWGLTLEPGILGVLLAPSLAGVLLGVAAMLAFLLRTPTRLVLLARLRGTARIPTAMGRERARLATRVAAVEALGLALAMVVAAVVADDLRWATPLVIVVPLFAVASWYDLRSLSRHLIPEVAGSVAVAGVAAMGALAGGAGWELAMGAWLILGARVASSVPHVRAQVARLHGRDHSPVTGLAGDTAAIVISVLAVLLAPELLLGALAIVVLVLGQRLTLARPPRPAKVLGLRQMALGFGVVAATAVGAWLP